MPPHSPRPRDDAGRPDQSTRGLRFAALHARSGAVLLPNLILQEGSKFDVAALRQLDVRRVSVGAYLGRLARDAMLHAATALRPNCLMAAFGQKQTSSLRLHLAHGVPHGPEAAEGFTRFTG